MKIILNAGLILILVACGKSPSKTYKAVGADSIKGKEWVTIPVSLNSTELGLASSASNFAVSLTNCSSGTTASASEGTPKFSIYKGDTACLAKLTGLTVNGVSYAATNPSAVAFATFAKDDTASFTDATGAHKIDLKVTSQLSSPVVAADVISYSFAITQSGDASTIANDVLGESHSIAVAGDVVPSYKIDKINFQGLNANGGGRFTFQLECLEAVKTGAIPSCANLALVDTSYVLVKDTFNGAPTSTQLSALFPGVSVLGSQLVLNTTGNLGGFLSNVVEGPNQLALNPKMILVLKNGNSFQYFLVTAQAL